MKKSLLCCIIVGFLSCNLFPSKIEKTQTAYIVMEKEQNGVVKSWISIEPIYLTVYNKRKALELENCKITLVKLFKDTHLHFDYELETFDLVPINHKQIIEILLYDIRDNLIDKLRFSVEIDCATTSFSGKKKWILKTIKNISKIYNIVIIPYSHTWKECNYFSVKQDVENKFKNYRRNQ